MATKPRKPSATPPTEIDSDVTPTKAALSHTQQGGLDVAVACERRTVAHRALAKASSGTNPDVDEVARAKGAVDDAQRGVDAAVAHRGRAPALDLCETLLAMPPASLSRTDRRHLTETGVRIAGAVDCGSAVSDAEKSLLARITARNL